MRGLYADTPETRIAVHEAGHLIVLWVCSYVTKIEGASISDQENGIAGVVEAPMRDDALYTDDGIWCRLVATLAGVAAEGLVYGGSIGHAGDVPRARQLVEELLARRYTLPASRGAGLRLPEGLEGDGPLAALAQAWRILGSSALFKPAVELLQAKRRVSEAEIVEALGPRPEVVGGLFALDDDVDPGQG
jgi:hypothetical protein